MGMYTQFHYGVRLKKDVPESVINTLRYMVRDIEEDYENHDHPLFATGNWEFMFIMDSYYFDYKTTNLIMYDEYGDWYFNVTCNFKNYDEEIEKFLDWIHPYVDAYDGDFLGYYRYEEDELPTLILYPDNMIAIKNGQKEQR